MRYLSTWKWDDKLELSINVSLLSHLQFADNLLVLIDYDPDLNSWIWKVRK